MERAVEGHPRRRFWFSPRWGVTCSKRRIWLRLADLSRVLSLLFFFREVHPASEMGSQMAKTARFAKNDQNDPNGLGFYD